MKGQACSVVHGCERLSAAQLPALTWRRFQTALRRQQDILPQLPKGNLFASLAGDDKPKKK